MKQNGETGDGRPRLRAPRHRVSRKAITWWTLEELMGVVMLLVPQLVAAFFWDAGRPWLVGTSIATVVLGAVACLVIPRWRYRVHRWEATGEAVYTRTGWFVQDWRVAPLSRIQTVDTQRGPVQQMLGLATVTVTTASAAGPLEIPGLDVDVAQRLVEELTAVTQATRGDAT
ncbi:PH domain-containing protein [Streptoalloteichus hindustanus]|uniref:YdbS-like PH domain-containing protein n=1 Tax=Streptoalloteichus hindustanus TaxID=2017 RepID=A0A1M5Q7T2_STRHI|nr:PH domain-containing protein [Streptoalloteichus hindustanus]SHH09966.1 hypothetical protein SAMN05444320_12223 [Streptoalloteichus hindustanus]